MFKLAATISFAAIALLPFQFASAQSHTAEHAGKTRVILQISDDDPQKWNLAFNNAKNIQKELGAKNVDMEIVAFGPGIGAFKADSEAASRVREAKADGVVLAACQNTMTAQQLKKEDMNSAVGYVPSGVVEIIKKEKSGYAYLRP